MTDKKEKDAALANLAAELYMAALTRHDARVQLACAQNAYRAADDEVSRIRNLLLLRAGPYSQRPTRVIRAGDVTVVAAWLNETEAVRVTVVGPDLETDL